MDLLLFGANPYLHLSYRFLAWNFVILRCIWIFMNLLCQFCYQFICLVWEHQTWWRLLIARAAWRICLNPRYISVSFVILSHVFGLLNVWQDLKGFGVKERLCFLFFRVLITSNIWSNAPLAFKSIFHLLDLCLTATVSSIKFAWH